jgi:hypothetical protein
MVNVTSAQSAAAPSLKKCRSLNSFAACLGSRNQASRDDFHVPELRASVTALPPPQPFVRVTLPMHFFATVAAQAPYRILTASNDLCSMLDLSMVEMQGRSLHILFGPETDASAVSLAMKAINMDKERQATIPAIKIYGRNGKGHLFRVRCVLAAKDGEKSCSVMMLFDHIQAQHQFIGSSRIFRNNARPRYNFITGLQIHASMVQSTSSGATPAPMPNAMPVRSSSVAILLSGHNRPASLSPGTATGIHYLENEDTSSLLPEDFELPLLTAPRRETMTATISARAPFRILDISQGLSTLLDYPPGKPSRGASPCSSARKRTKAPSRARSSTPPPTARAGPPPCRPRPSAIGTGRATPSASPAPHARTAPRQHAA